MPIDPSQPADNVKASKSAIRANFASIKAKADSLPESYTGQGGEVLVVNAAAQGPTTASQAGTVTASFENLPVGRFKQDLIAITANVTLTDALHGGGVLMCSNASAITITVVKSATPSLGVSDGFICKIRRAGVGAVQIAFDAALTNKNPDGHTRVVADRFATLEVWGSNVFLDGYTEA